MRSAGRSSRFDRLDRPTSGVLLFALDRKSAGLLQQAFEQRNVRKTYHAIVCGIPPQRWVCKIPLQAGPDDAALAAQTTFERLRESAFPGDPSLILSLIQAQPASGRFHQIRRHLLAAGFPIVGDFRYAGEERSHELGRILGTGTRMLLQAKRLEFQHPHSGQPLRIEAPSDRDFPACFQIERTIC